MAEDVKKQGTKIMMDIKDFQKQFILPSISLWLDDYNDLFSDFDNRPYAQRALSKDFLDEAERASKDKDNAETELNLFVPAAKRAMKEEAIIKRRLNEHFKKHHDILDKKYKGLIKQGAYFTVFGIMIMLIATTILFKYSDTNLFARFIVVFFEPAGWFLFWEGLNLVIFESKKTRPDLEFHRKMTCCRIRFSSY